MLRRKLTTGIFVTLVVSLVNRGLAKAQEYSCGAYGAGDFGEGDCVGSGDLSDTGINVWLIRALAALLLLLALALLAYAIKKRHDRKNVHSE